MSEVILEVNNRNFLGWNRLNIHRSMEELCANFTLQLVDAGVNSEFGHVQIGDRCRIYVRSEAENIAVNEIELLTGYIDEIEKNRSGESTSMSVSGRDITQDLVDCSAVIPSNTWTKASLDKIAKDLAAPFDIYVNNNTNEEEFFNKLTIQNGETCFSVLERACRQNGVLPLTNRFGELTLQYAASDETPRVADLVDGENILSISETVNHRARFSEYTVRGQTSGRGNRWSKKTNRLKGTAKDNTLKRHRPLIILAENKTTSKKIKKRANWEAQVRAGRSLVHTVQLVGWFTAGADESSELQPWTPNMAVNLISEPFNVNAKKIITSVDFGLDETGGRVTTLVLKHPDTYAADPSGNIEF